MIKTAYTPDVKRTRTKPAGTRKGNKASLKHRSKEKHESVKNDIGPAIGKKQHMIKKSQTVPGKSNTCVFTTTCESPKQGRPQTGFFGGGVRVNFADKPHVFADN